MTDDHWIIVLYNKYVELFGDPDHPAAHPKGLAAGSRADAGDPLVAASPTPDARTRQNTQPGLLQRNDTSA